MKVFSREKYLRVMDEIAPDEAEMRRQFPWPFECEGKTEEECNLLGFVVHAYWMEEKDMGYKGGRMKFDKTKILTVVTADQAKVGQKGWFASNVETLSRLVLEEQPKELLGFNSNNAVHVFKTCLQNHALFYPAPEPTYAERQAEWVKQNNIKGGTKVRFTKNFTTGEDGSGCCGHKDAKGMEGLIISAEDDYLFVLVPALRSWTVPFTALEVIKEPTYRPFHDDELNDIVGKVVVQNHTGNAMLIIKIVDSETGKVVSLGGSQKRNAQQLLDGWIFKDGHPCGVKEEIR